MVTYICDFRMLCPVCTEDVCHRTWCEYHPANTQNSAWPPALPVTPSAGEWLQQMSRQSETEDGNLGGVGLDETPLVGIISLDNNVNLDEPVDNLFTTTGENESQTNEQSVNDITWSMIEEVLKDNDTDQNIEMNVPERVGPHTPDSSPISEVKISQMWV
jgi:hypothetical protein